jgi:hypothetical protein
MWIVTVPVLGLVESFSEHPTKVKRHKSAAQAKVVVK